jgi:hypothetical protein
VTIPITIAIKIQDHDLIGHSWGGVLAPCHAYNTLHCQFETPNPSRALDLSKRNAKAAIRKIIEKHATSVPADTLVTRACA